MKIEKRFKWKEVEGSLLRSVSFYKRDVLTEEEFVSTFIHTLVGSGYAAEIHKCEDLVPDSIQPILEKFVTQIEKGGYKWRSIIIGKSPFRDEEFDRDYEDGLRTLRDVMFEGKKLE